MRLILFCLIVSNVLYLGWQLYWVPASAETRPTVQIPQPSEPGSPGKRLVLLKDLVAANDRSGPPPSINRAVREKLTANSERKSKQPEPNLETGAKAGQQKVAPVVPEVSSVDPVSDESQASPPLQGASGKTQSEGKTPSEPPSETVASAPPALVKDEDPALSRVCARVGPYSEKEEAQNLVQALESGGISPSLRADTVVYDVENWVLMPPLVNRTEALRMLRRLQSNKIDSYLITEGEFSNGISLGLFKQAGSAQGVLAKMTSAGYEAEIHRIERTRDRFWVSFEGDFEAAQINEMLTQLVEDSEKINFSETLCEMFASTP